MNPNSLSSSATSFDLSPPPTGSSLDEPPDGAAYDRIFWLIYVANTSLMVAVSVLFRYSDFVSQAGGTPVLLGWIVGIGMVGALAMRAFQGVGIDRYGPRLVWLLSLVLFVISMLGHLPITSVHGPTVYLMRILLMTSLAGAFGASITFVSLRVPERRMAEIIGMLGSSGFIGMAVGPALGDIVFGSGPITRGHVQNMFWLAAAMGVISLVCAALATRGHIRPPRRKSPPPLSLIRRYHPGVLLVVAVAMGLGIGLPGVFVRPYAESVGIAGIKTYFFVYTATAFIVRIGTRRSSERFGVRPMILAGLGSLSASMLLYLLVRNEWSLAIPAVFAGTAHACLFPSVVSGGSLTFPARYRGLATTLMLSMFDMGNLLGQPAVSGILDFARRNGLPQFATMFVGVSAIVAAVAILYSVVTQFQSRRRVVRKTEHKQRNVSLSGQRVSATIAK